MKENFPEKIAEDSNEEMPDRIPLEYRNPFQMEVFELLIYNGLLDKNDMSAIEKYSRIISDFIDDPTHKEIREMIMQKRNKEAVEIMILELEKKYK